MTASLSRLVDLYNASDFSRPRAKEADTAREKRNARMRNFSAIYALRGKLATA